MGFALLDMYGILRHMVDTTKGGVGNPNKREKAIAYCIWAILYGREQIVISNRAILHTDYRPEFHRESNPRGYNLKKSCFWGKYEFVGNPEFFVKI